MTATARSGINAIVMIDTSSGGTSAAVAVSGRNKWTFDQNRAFFETTEFGATTKSYVPGLPDSVGTIEGVWDSADNNIYNIIGATTERNLKIYPDFTNNNTTYISGKAFFAAKYDGGIASPVNFVIDFQAGPTGLSWVHP